MKHLTETKQDIAEAERHGRPVQPARRHHRLGLGRYLARELLSLAARTTS